MGKFVTVFTRNDHMLVMLLSLECLYSDKWELDTLSPLLFTLDLCVQCDIDYWEIILIYPAPQLPWGVYNNMPLTQV